MKKWIVCYEEKGGDIAKVWLYADSAEQAEQDARCEYWDIAEIIYVTEME